MLARIRVMSHLSLQRRQVRQQLLVYQAETSSNLVSDVISGALRVVGHRLLNVD